MHPLKSIFIFCFIFFSAIPSWSQFGYRVEIFNEPFEYLEGATSLVDSTEAWLNPQIQVPIGFTTTILDDTTSTLYTNGILGGVLYTDENYSTNSIAAFLFYYTYLADRSAVAGVPHSPISAMTIGDPGDRIFKFEYKDAGFYSEIAAGLTAENRTSVQFWLYEKDGTWEVRMGPNHIPNPEGIFDYGTGPNVGIGKIDPINGDNQLYLVNDQDNPPSLDSVGMDDFQDYSVQFPDSSLVIRFYQLALDTKSPVQLEGIELFPSLAEDVVHVSIDNLEVLNQEVEIKVYDLSGRRYYYNQSKQEALHEIQVGHLVAGKYFVSIQTEDGFKTVPFVKM